MTLCEVLRAYDDFFVYTWVGEECIKGSASEVANRLKELGYGTLPATAGKLHGNQLLWAPSARVALALLQQGIP